MNLNFNLYYITVIITQSVSMLANIPASKTLGDFDVLYQKYYSTELNI